jgi:hypothetical protein
MIAIWAGPTCDGANDSWDNQERTHASFSRNTEGMAAGQYQIVAQAEDQYLQNTAATSRKAQNPRNAIHAALMSSATARAVGGQAL